MQDFILSHYDTFENNMKARKQYALLVEALTKKGEFLNVKVTNSVVVHNYHKLYNSMMSVDFVSVHIEEYLDIFLHEALMMCFPIRDFPDRYVVKEFITKQIDGLDAPMKGSAVHKSLQRKSLLRSNSKIGETLADEKELRSPSNTKMLGTSCPSWMTAKWARVGKEASAKQVEQVVKRHQRRSNNDSRVRRINRRSKRRQ